MSFQFSTGLFSLFPRVSSLQPSFMTGWVEGSFTPQRNYLFLMDSSETALCYEDMGMFKRGNSQIKDKRCSFFLTETHDKLFMVSAQKLRERMMWIGVTGIFCTLWTSGRQKLNSSLFIFFFRGLSATFSVWIINCGRRQINRSRIQHMTNVP